ncbi:MAG TPA: hypothetical protein VGX03_07695 [Candidatus Binatia bacterium]|jgi:hypothetical protein|nr:hypothetical protein [Candidatus Binatia bacterium]
MLTVAELIDQIRLLPSYDQRQILKELQVLVEKESDEEQETGEGPYAHSLALAGTIHANFTDISTDKYKHLVEAYANRHEDK